MRSIFLVFFRLLMKLAGAVSGRGVMGLWLLGGLSSRVGEESPTDLGFEGEAVGLGESYARGRNRAAVLWRGEAGAKV